MYIDLLGKANEEPCFSTVFIILNTKSCFICIYSVNLLLLSNKELLGLSS